MPFSLSFARLLDIVLPRACLLCGAAADAAVCAGCRDELPRLPANTCPVCATPLTQPAPACGECLKTPRAFDQTFAVWEYAYPVDHLVMQLKFACHLASVDFFAAGMRAAARPVGDLIVPVPLSPRRLRTRGFNQALEIARPLARALNIPLETGMLFRCRETVPQSQLPWRARHHNVRHAFECRAEVSGKTVIVVDDVMTTGATLDAIAQVLKDHGATRVINWIATRAVKRLT